MLLSNSKGKALEKRLVSPLLQAKTNRYVYCVYPRGLLGMCFMRFFSLHRLLKTPAVLKDDDVTSGTRTVALHSVFSPAQLRVNELNLSYSSGPQIN